jgi:hypothetical protein
MRDEVDDVGDLGQGLPDRGAYFLIFRVDDASDFEGGARIEATRSFVGLFRQQVLNIGRRAIRTVGPVGPVLCAFARFSLWIECRSHFFWVLAVQTLHKSNARSHARVVNIIGRTGYLLVIALSLNGAYRPFPQRSYQSWRPTVPCPGSMPRIFPSRICTMRSAMLAASGL